jgi:hypothetical protein
MTDRPKNDDPRTGKDFAEALFEGDEELNFDGEGEALGELQGPPPLPPPPEEEDVFTSAPLPRPSGPKPPGRTTIPPRGEALPPAPTDEELFEEDQVPDAADLAARGGRREEATRIASVDMVGLVAEEKKAAPARRGPSVIRRDQLPAKGARPAEPAAAAAAAAAAEATRIADASQILAEKKSEVIDL